VDTGASVSVFPHLPCSPSASGSGIQLKTTNGSPMNTYNFRCMALQFGSRRFEWSFVLANVSMSLLGSYFLCCNHLLVDIAGSCLHDSYTLESIPAILSSSSNSSSDLYTALLSTQSIQSAVQAGQFLPKPAKWMQRNLSELERKLQPWKLQGLSEIPLLLGPVLYTW